MISRAKSVMLSIILSLLLLPVLPLPSHAQQSGITDPKSGAVVAGIVQIKGTAVHPQFQRYELYYSPEPPTNNSWVFIGQAHTQQVINGLLGTWDTRSVPDGRYALRLRVVRLDGNYDEYFVRNLQVSNTKPTATPTPAVTPTPTITPTPLPPTPTIIISVPGEGAAGTPTPTPTPARTAVTPPPTPTKQAGGGGFKKPTDLNPGISLKKSFMKGVKITLKIAAVVLALYLIKWAFSLAIGTFYRH